MSASGIIGTFLGVRSPGTAYVLLHHYMGEIDGAFRSWGLSRGGTGAVSNAIAAAARELGVEIRTEAPVAQHPHEERPRHRRRARQRRRDRGQRRGLERRSEPDVPEVHGRARAARGFRRGRAPLQVPRLVGQGQPRARRAARTSPACPGPGPHLRGAISISPSIDYMERAYDDAKYGQFSRRPYIDMVIPSLTDPSVAPPGKHVMSCFVQYAPYHLKDGGLGRSPARGVRRCGDQRDRGVRAEHQGHHPAPAGADAARHRARLRAHRRQHLPGRAHARAVVLPAAGAGLGAVHDADRSPLHVRLGDASGRRHHGRARQERRRANPEESSR